MPAAQAPSSLTVDFSQVGDRTEGGRAAHVPPGDYLVQVKGVELKSKKDDSTSKYLNWKLAITAPEKFKSAGIIYFITSLKSESLWNLRNFLEDLGINVPKSSVKLPLADIVKKAPVLGVTVDDDEYGGKTKSKIVATFKKSAFEATGTSEESSDDEDADTTPEASDDEDLDEIGLDDL